MIETKYLTIELPTELDRFFAVSVDSAIINMVEAAKIEAWPPHVSFVDGIGIRISLHDELDKEMSLRELIKEAIHRHGFNDPDEKAGLLRMAQELRGLAIDIENSAP